MWSQRIGNVGLACKTADMETEPWLTRRLGVQARLRPVKARPCYRHLCGIFGWRTRKRIVDSLNISISIMRRRASQGATAECVWWVARMPGESSSRTSKARELGESCKACIRRTAWRSSKYRGTYIGPPALPRISLPQACPDFPDHVGHAASAPSPPIEVLK